MDAQTARAKMRARRWPSAVVRRRCPPTQPSHSRRSLEEVAGRLWPDLVQTAGDRGCTSAGEVTEDQLETRAPTSGWHGFRTGAKC